MDSLDFTKLVDTIKTKTLEKKLTWEYEDELYSCKINNKVISIFKEKSKYNVKITNCGKEYLKFSTELDDELILAVERSAFKLEERIDTLISDLEGL